MPEETVVGRLLERLGGPRGARGLPGWGQRLPAPVAAVVLRQLGRWRRAYGFYDVRTLALLRRAWGACNDAHALLDYLSFRRDLGRPLTCNVRTLLEQRLVHLSGGRRRLAQALLVEAEAASQHAAIAAAPVPGTASTLEQVRAGQVHWRAGFQAALEQARQGSGICVVGNAGSMTGSGAGAWIDAHTMVLRFNRFQGDSAAHDIGSRLDAWVGAPGLRDTPPHGAEWLVVSGPEMQFRMQDWLRFDAALRAGRPVLTVPLGVWASLVKKLAAPPSAGLLMLAWLRRMLGTWDGIDAVGFDAPVGPRAYPYHHANSQHRPAGRHHWAAERSLLRQWQGQGLRLATYG